MYLKTTDNQMYSKTTRFESLLEAVPDALVGMDQKGVIRFVNRQTELLFGYDRDDMVGQPIETLVPESLWQIYAEHREDYFADLRTRSSGLELVLSGRQRDGTEFPVNISLSHIDTGDVLLVVTAVRDVTNQRRAVEAAQLTAAVVKYSNDAIIGGTPAGTITSWNPAAERLYGYSREEIIGKSGSILIPHDRTGEFYAVRAKVKNGEAVERLETMRVRKDGTVFPVSITVAPIHDEDGAIVGASAVHRDVTRQRQAFEVARRMATMVEVSGEAIIGSTLDGTITSWNPAAERLYGYSREEIVGTSATVLMPEDRTGEEVSDIMAKIRAGEHVENFETSRVRKDGTLFPISLTVTPIYDAGGAIIGASSTPRDMTRHGEEFGAAQRLAAIVEYSNDAIIGKTLDGTITSWNPAAERMYGYSSEEIIGKPVELLSPEGQTRESTATLARIRAGRPVEPQETMGVRKDGTTIRVSLTVSPIHDENGAIVGTSTIARDVTEQR